MRVDTAPSNLLSLQRSTNLKVSVYILWAGPIQNFGFKIHFRILGFNLTNCVELFKIDERLPPIHIEAPYLVLTHLSSPKLSKIEFLDNN